MKKLYFVIFILLTTLFLFYGCVENIENSSAVNNSENATSAVSNNNEHETSAVNNDENAVSTASNNNENSEKVSSAAENSDVEDSFFNIFDDDDEWQLRLVNAENPIDDYTPEVVNFTLFAREGCLIDVRIKKPLEKLLRAAKKDDVELLVYSGYRSFDRQVEVFNNNVQRLINNGLYEEDATNETKKTIAIPGTSEHQYGLAVDLVNHDFAVTNPSGVLEESFENTKAAKWLMKNAPKYGFILRYPKNKTHITNIDYEPWHYRYVGVKHAKKITESGVTLEEYR